MMGKKSSKSGFTVIEVVLVLAIAGLIFLMVFVALPALQRNQRNLQRKHDADRVSAAIQKYLANNNKLPAGSSERTIDPNFVIRYVDNQCKVDRYAVFPEILGSYGGYYYKDCSDQFIDPNGNEYIFTQLAAPTYPSSTDYPNTMAIGVGMQCTENEGVRAVKNGKKYYALITILEGGSIYCTDNS